MREWFEKLAPREQWMVGAAAVLVLAMLYYLIVWEPLSKASQRLDADLLASQQLVSQMQQTRAEVASLGGSRAAAVQPSNRSLLSVVDSSGKRSGVAKNIKRIQPEGQSKVRLWLEDAPFEPLLAWLKQLESNQGIVLGNGSLDRDDRAGTVQARLTLTRQGGS